MKDTRYDFGNNWYDFLSKLDQTKIDSATNELKQLAGDLTGKTFIDIGSGSGLHSLAAFNLGASTVTAFDYDPMSVKSTNALLSKYVPNKQWEATQGDILTTLTPAAQFDVVYSYGVLHHTGDMWKAIENASAYCKKDSIFVLALYVKTPFCELWKKEKEIYSRYKTLRPILDAAMISLVFMRRLLSAENPFKYISEYESRRGMNFFTDIRDWLGGYPYQSVADEELQAFMADRGFSLMLSRNTKPGVGLLGTACGEWVFKKG